MAVPCRIATVNSIIREIRSTWRTESLETEDAVIQKYVNCQLLVIDEVGSQYGTDSERIIINEIINDRYEWGHPTVLIGNITAAEAKEILGTRVFDRVKDNGELLVFDWESHRKLRNK